jgi:hypothetical protein
MEKGQLRAICCTKTNCNAEKPTDCFAVVNMQFFLFNSKQLFVNSIIFHNFVVIEFTALPLIYLSLGKECVVRADPAFTGK